MDFEGLLGNPWIHLGAGILGHNTSDNAGAVLGRGVTAGLGSYQAAQMADLQRTELMRKRAAAEQEAQQRQDLASYFQQSGNPFGAVAPMKMAEAHAAQLARGPDAPEITIGPDGKPMYIRREEAFGKPAFVKPGSTFAPSFSVGDVNAMVEKTEETGAKQIAPMLMQGRTAAENAAEQIRTSEQVMRSIFDVPVYAGPLANQQQFLAQMSSKLGFASEDTEQAMLNTRKVIRGLAEFALQARGTLKGQGAISEGEQKVLTKARSGDIADLTVPEIQIIADAAHRAGLATVKRHTEDVDRYSRMSPGTAMQAPFFAGPESPQTIHRVRGPEDMVNVPEGAMFVAPNGKLLRNIKKREP